MSNVLVNTEMNPVIQTGLRSYSELVTARLLATILEFKHGALA